MKHTIFFVTMMALSVLIAVLDYPNDGGSPPDWYVGLVLLLIAMIVVAIVVLVRDIIHIVRRWRQQERRK